jgi:hypothetical protein
MAKQVRETIEAGEAGREQFWQSVSVEWTKFWSNRRRAAGIVAGAIVIVIVGLLVAAGTRISSDGPERRVLVGPGGEAVTDRFYFVHQPLAGDGSVTARLASMSGVITYPPPNHDQIVAGLVPWAKAGVMVKESVERGSAYAAVMLTGSYGVRMQSNFVRDSAGRPGGVSAERLRWLRLTRSGDLLTGFESSDGKEWTEVSKSRLDGMPETVEAGIFVASPSDVTVYEGAARFTNATAVFDHVSLEGNASRGGWIYDDIGARSGLPTHLRGQALESGHAFTVTGTCDIAPRGFPEGVTVEFLLIGASLGSIAFILVAVTFATSEYRRGLIGSVGAQQPAAKRVLAAKALVIGAITFVAGLAATSTVVALGLRLMRAGGNTILPVAPVTEVRVVAGTAAMLAMAALLGLALGTLFRRAWLAVLAAIGAAVLPLFVAVALVLPVGPSHWEMRLAASKWLLRLTPAAGFAIRQSIPEYPQVIGPYTALMGYYPLSPWAGFAVLSGYTALALGLAGCLPEGAT